MSTRQFFLLNPVNYKVKKIFWLIAFFLISNILIFLAAAYFIVNEYRVESRSLSQLKTAVSTEDALIKSYITSAEKINSDSFSIDTDKIKSEHDKSLNMISSYINSMESRGGNVSRFFSGFIVIVTMLTTILFLIIVMIFSKIIGPVYHINRIIKSYLNGEKVEFRPVREGDEFEELYTNVVNLIEKKEQ
ncbi:MAG: hypothetical protein JW982_08065 [Spirochaetes bacterium]|nr:hypothetical protein [Spirochaetota bacterium]